MGNHRKSLNNHRLFVDFQSFDVFGSWKVIKIDRIKEKAAHHFPRGGRARRTPCLQIEFAARVPRGEGKKGSEEGRKGGKEEGRKGGREENGEREQKRGVCVSVRVKVCCAASPNATCAPRVRESCCSNAT